MLLMISRRIVNDRTRVGDHCLSWIAGTDDEQKVRCKVYNKFVQMMESADNMSSLGTRIESIVIPVDKKFHKRLRHARKSGLTRLEVTFYGGQLYDHAYYANYMKRVKEMIRGCATFAVPFEAYWKSMASNINGMIGIYAYGANAKESGFAYCHWWNSVTAKKYGSMRKNVNRDEALKLLANYSFNDRPIYFLEISLDEPEKEIVVSRYE